MERDSMPCLARFYRVLIAAFFAVLGAFVSNVHAATVSCNNGYTRNTGADAVLNQRYSTSETLRAYIGSEGYPKVITCEPGSTYYQASHCTGNNKDWDWVPGIKESNNEKGVWGILFAENFIEKTLTVVNPLHLVYGKSSCNAEDGSVPPGAMRYSEKDDQIMVGNDNGGKHCWCKMTNFNLYGQSNVNTPDTPWVYLQPFEANGNKTGAQRCAKSCTEKCTTKLINDSFFRSQVFGKYSTCTPETYNIEYELNGGHWINEEEVETQYTVVYKPITTPNAERDNFDFAGWCEGVNNPKSSTCAQQKTIPTGSYGNKTFYARWKTHISFEPGTVDTTGSMLNKDVYYNETNIQLPQSSFSRIGYDFDEWECVVDGTDTIVPLTNNIISKYEYDNSITCTAKWSLHTYAIYYNSHDSDVGFANDLQPTSFTIESEDITIMTPESNNSQYEFAGWCVDKNDNCTNAQLQQSYTITSGTVNDVYLWAHWTRTSCENGFYLQDNVCYSCAEMTNGLYSESNGASANSLNDCYAICPAQPQDCPEHYASCIYDTETVSFNNGNYISEYDADIAPCGITYTCAEHYSRNIETFTCDPDVFTVTYYDETNVITELSSDYGSYAYGDGLVLPTASEVAEYYLKQNYDFAGWYNTLELTGNAVTEISAQDYGNKTFYAKWTPASYHIEFLPGKAGNRTEGFSGIMSSQPVNYGDENITLNANAFSITGYEFKEWYCTAMYNNHPFEGTFSDNDTITEYIYDGGMVCTARWQAKSFNLTRNCGDGGELADGQEATISIDYDGLYSLTSSLCKPRDNYSIVSWTCTNGLNPDDSTWLITENSTCTANWDETSHQILYKNTSSNLTPKTYKTSETPLTVPNTNPGDTAYAQFKGWCIGETDNCTDDQLQTNYTIPDGTSGDVVMWANWIATACPAGQYLDSQQCKGCPGGYTSAEGTTGGQDQCYYDWYCNDSCPDNSTCSLVSGESGGRIWYGSDTEYTCEIVFECNPGYVKNASGDACVAEEYSITYIDGVNELPERGTFTIEDNTIQLLSLPDKQGYRFLGWCIDTEVCSTNNIVKGFASGPWDTGDKTLYAQWEEVEFVCSSGKLFHVGDDAACLTTTKQSSPALVLRKGSNKYYMKMTEKDDNTNGLNMNEDSNKQINILYKGTLYNAHDTSVE